jgi:hypothetical protein
LYTRSEYSNSDNAVSNSAGVIVSGMISDLSVSNWLAGKRPNHIRRAHVAETLDCEIFSIPHRY